MFVVGAKKVNHDDEYDHDIDGLIIEYNQDLEKVNETVYKDHKNGLERFNKVIEDSDKNLVVVGHEAVLDQKKSTKKENAYYYKGIIVKYNRKLEVLNHKVYHENEDDYFTNIIEENNLYLVSGYHRYNANHYRPFFLGFEKKF